ncbi:MAG: glycosyltransferase [Candidatus Fermentibacteria bacterium]|nr:glycosyltransferase [Candidatus Fermentibacteria bacterium]
MRILVTASGSFQEVELFCRMLTGAGHDVLSGTSEDGAVFHPDVTVCYGSAVVTAQDSPVVSVISSGTGRHLSPADVHVFSSRHLIPPGFHGRAVVIPHAVDTKKFKPAGKSGAKIIIAPGKLNPEQGHKTLIRAMHLVKPDYNAVFIGQEGYYSIEQMNSYAREIGVGDRVQFSGGVESLHSFPVRAAVGVVTGYPRQLEINNVIELMASGVPLLVAAADWSRDIVTDGVTALFHSPGNWKQLAGQINHLMENNGLCDMLSGNAGEYCRKYLSFESVGQRWTEVLEQLSFG